MLPWSRGLRKEFLPLYDRGANGQPILKPVAHLVVETLTRAGCDQITLVVQPKDAVFVRNYFTVDPAFLERHQDHAERLTETRRFYSAIRKVHLTFTVQPTPAGFGDAVLRARRSVGNEPFLLHAGDAVLLEARRGFLLEAMAECREREDADAVLLVRRVAEPRRYGVVEGRAARPFRGIRRLDVSGMAEKPAHPRSHWAATAVYAFGPALFPAIETYRRSEHPRELEVTDGIRQMIADGARVVALVLDPKLGTWQSVGSPDGYSRALVRTRAVARRTDHDPND